MERLVINGGHLIDPANNISSKLNIAIENGKIVEISNKILKGDKVIDAEGLGEIFKELRELVPEIITIGHVMNEKNVDKAIAHPNVIIASDGLMNNYQGHPRAAGTFPRLINEYVKNKKIINLYQAIKKITYLPAKRFGINKGILSINSDADIVIFNFDEIKDNATFEKPEFKPSGIKHVIVNGQMAIRDSKLVNTGLGRFIK